MVQSKTHFQRISVRTLAHISESRARSPYIRSKNAREGTSSRLVFYGLHTCGLYLFRKSTHTWWVPTTGQKTVGCCRRAFRELQLKRVRGRKNSSLNYKKEAAHYLIETPVHLLQNNQAYFGLTDFNWLLLTCNVTLHVFVTHECN